MEVFNQPNIAHGADEKPEALAANPEQPSIQQATDASREDFNKAFKVVKNASTVKGAAVTELILEDGKHPPAPDARKPTKPDVAQPISPDAKPIETVRQKGTVPNDRPDTPVAGDTAVAAAPPLTRSTNDNDDFTCPANGFRYPA